MCYEVLGLECMILIFWMLGFKPVFSLSSFTFIKRLLSSTSLSAIRVVSSAYLMLLIFLMAFFIPACVSSSPAFHMILCIWVKYSGWQYTTLTFSFPNFEPVCWSLSGSNCYFLTCTQVSQETGKVVWYPHLFKNFPQFVVIHIVKGFSIVSESKVDIFLAFSYFFCNPTDVGNLISGFSAISKSSFYIWKFSVHILLKPSLEDFEHDLASMWNECSCVVVWSFFGIALLWNWNVNWPFPVVWPLLSIPNLLAYWVQNFNNIILLGFEVAQLEFYHLHQLCL